MQFCLLSWRAETRDLQNFFQRQRLESPLAEHDDVDVAFAWKEERTVSFNLACNMTSFCS